MTCVSSTQASSLYRVRLALQDGGDFCSLEMSAAAPTNQQASSPATIHREQPIDVTAAAADAVVLVTAHLRHRDVTPSTAHRDA